MKRILFTLALFWGCFSAHTAAAQAFTRVLHHKNAPVKTPEIVSVFPNPAATNTTVVLSRRSEQKIYAEIYNYDGNLKHTYAFDPGTDLLNIDLGTLERGNYILRIRENGRLIQAVRIIKN